jgi:hypothetical protein
MPLLAVSPRHSWAQAAPALLDEAFDRNVLWICKHDPSLVEEYEAAGQKVGPPALASESPRGAAQEYPANGPA